MSYRYEITAEAFQELDQEIEYSKKHWGIAHANKYRRNLMSLCQKIAENPEAYAFKPDLGEGLRAIRFKGNLICLYG